MSEKVNHPNHYGGADNPYEAIKVIEAWDLNFNLGNATKYISRAGKKGEITEDLKKAIWYLQREVKKLEGGSKSDALLKIHLETLKKTGETIIDPIASRVANKSDRY